MLAYVVVVAVLHLISTFYNMYDRQGLAMLINGVVASWGFIIYNGIVSPTPFVYVTALLFGLAWCYNVAVREAFPASVNMAFIVSAVYVL